METISLILGTYVITLSLTQSDGAWGILYKLRHNKHIEDFGILDCFLCTSFWVSLILCISFQNIPLFFIVWGISVILDKLLTSV